MVKSFEVSEGSPILHTASWSTGQRAMVIRAPTSSVLIQCGAILLLKEAATPTFSRNNDKNITSSETHSSAYVKELLLVSTLGFVSSNPIK